MGLINNEFIQSNENLSKDEFKELLGINERTFKYYREIGLLKGTKTRRKGKYILSPRDINLLSFIKELRRVGLPLSEVKKIDGIHKILHTNNRIKLLRLYTLLEELFEKIEHKKRELEQLREDILDFKNYLQISTQLSEKNLEIWAAKEDKLETDFMVKSNPKGF
jgi:DNA-binding transcriptional MerR regulator